MTAEQVKVFEQLLNDKDFIGKKQLKHLLWANTVKPKFKVGDCFIVSDPGRRVYGYPVKNFKAKVTEIKAWTQNDEWHYTLQMEVKCGFAKTTSQLGASESQLSRCQRCEDNENILGVRLSEYVESIEL